MAILKASQPKSVDISVIPDLFQIDIHYGQPARVDFMNIGPARDFAHGNQLFKIRDAKVFLEGLNQELPVVFRIGDGEIEVSNDDELAQIKRFVANGIEIASKVVLEIDLPKNLLEWHERACDQYYCHWPTRYGGRFLVDIPHIDTGELRHAEQFEFSDVGYPNGLAMAFEETCRYFSNLQDACVGESVVVTLRNYEKKLESVTLQIGDKKEPAQIPC